MLNLKPEALCCFGEGHGNFVSISVSAQAWFELRLYVPVFGLFDLHTFFDSALLLDQNLS